MRAWIPNKEKIESILIELAEKLRKSDTVSDIEEYLCDELSVLECHISNRAGIEAGRIKEPDRRG